MVLLDPLGLDNRLRRIDEGYFLKTFSEIKDAVYQRGILFLTFRKNKKWLNLPDSIDILKPDIISDKFSIFFNDADKTILYKINQEEIEKFSQIKKEIDLIIKKLKLSPTKSDKKEINKAVRGGKNSNLGVGRLISFTTSKLDGASFIRTHCGFLLLKPKKYNEVKRFIKKKFINDGKKTSLDDEED